MTRRQLLDVRGADRRRPGIRVRRTRTLEDDEVVVLDGIPVAAPARTLYDLAGWVSTRRLERAVAEAHARGTSVDVNGHEVDLLWRQEALAVEVDGFAYHSSRSRFEGTGDATSTSPRRE